MRTPGRHAKPWTPFQQGLALIFAAAVLAVTVWYALH
jgi:hypothetical protein